MSQNQNGSTSVAVSVIMTILFIVALAFGGWALMGRQDYKNNTDKKVASAVAVAEKSQAEQLRQQFDEESKNPNKTYKTSAVLGSVNFKYPKTWNAYLDNSNAGEPLNGYFYPNIVPSTQSNTAFALRAELINSTYADVIKQYAGSISQHVVKARAFLPPKMKGVPNVQTGIRLDGAVVFDQNNPGNTKQGARIAIAVRDKTLVLTTQSPNYISDFNKIVLPSITFSP